ncbi:MAG: helix-turn-helix transcriptional regulator [Deltaproteobacteria bacterium]|nr:helix-turn-helix transcriptional regulator [Deltaproteobacteria bacterium]
MFTSEAEKVSLPFQANTALSSPAGRPDFPVEKEVLEILEVASIRLGDSHGNAKRSITDAISFLAAKIQHAPELTSRKCAGATLSFRQVRRIREYIDQHIDQRIEVATLGFVVGRSTSHLSRLFKHTLGLAPHAYLTQRRIALACKLLGETDLAMCEIALRCGFSDQAHFSRSFRRSMGVNPTSWRRAIADNERAVTLEGPARRMNHEQRI